jgi:hypothetical protein
MDESEVARITYENAMKVFHLWKKLKK